MVKCHKMTRAGRHYRSGVWAVDWNGGAREPGSKPGKTGGHCFVFEPCAFFLQAERPHMSAGHALALKPSC